MSFAKGDFIIKQGDKGDNFYILDEGECDISVEGKGSVMTATKGIAFGELALLHNAPRAATVQVGAILRNSCAILAHFWRNSGAILAQLF